MPDRWSWPGDDELGVAARSAEAPPELLAAADLVVEGPPGTRDLLQRLGHVLAGGRAQPP